MPAKGLLAVVGTLICVKREETVAHSSTWSKCQSCFIEFLNYQIFDKTVYILHGEKVSLGQWGIASYKHISG